MITILQKPTPRLNFALTCDRLQRDKEGERAWIWLMAHARRINQKAFLSAVDLGELLDPGENFSDFVADDPNAGCYSVQNGADRILFFQARGFEFFFTADGSAPRTQAPSAELIAQNDECSHNPMAALLLGANDPRMQGSLGFERKAVDNDPRLALYESDQGKLRFVLHDNNEKPVSAMSLTRHGANGYVIDSVYTAKDARRQGWAQTLWQMVCERVDHVQHSDSLTDEGRAWALAMQASESDGASLTSPKP